MRMLTSRIRRLDWSRRSQSRLETSELAKASPIRDRCRLFLTDIDASYKSTQVSPILYVIVIPSYLEKHPQLPA